MPIKKDSVGLRWMLDSRGLKYSWVAAQLGIAPSTLTRVMNGERRLTPQARNKLSDILGVAPEELAESLTRADQPA